MRQKDVMSWSLRIQNDDYRHDFERYGNKIRSIGFHEWDVDGAGNIAIYKLSPTKADGLYTSWTDATTYNRYAAGRELFPNYIEKDMRRWPHIEYYMQMVIFGPETVSRLLDSTTAQNNFINNLNKVVSLYRKDQNGQELGYTGIEIDCEGSFSDAIWDQRAGDNEKLIGLLERIKHEVILDNHPDLKLRVNAHAMWGEGVPDYYRFHDYKLFADMADRNGNPLLDEVQIMTYDFSWSGSAPGPSTPLWWMQNVADWVKKCFDPAENPQAKCTIDKVYLGAAGYGRRWPIHDEDNYGTSVTYRNLVDWQNGYYIHHRGEGEMANQDFIPLNAMNDDTSDNQIMYPGAYDYFRARHLQRARSMDQITARLSSYNGVEYVTAYSKNQHMEIEGFAGVTGVKDVSEPTHNLDKYDDPKRSETINMTFGEGEEDSFTFQAYNTRRIPYVPTFERLEDGSIREFCTKSKQPETELTYKLNVPSGGTYEVAAVVSFPFYGNAKLNGSGPGKTFTIGGDIPDYYPMMFKGGHMWHLGTFNLAAGDNTFKILGKDSQHGTIIFGFVAARKINLEVVGGYLTASANVQPFLKRDRSQAKLPDKMVLTNEILQQAPRPAIMWEDFFQQFLTDEVVQENGLTATTYYRANGKRKDYGGGTKEERNEEGELTRCYEEVQAGYSEGTWMVGTDANGVACAKFDHTKESSGQLVLNYKFNEMNVSCECQFSMSSGQRAGIRFATTKPGVGYIFFIDFSGQSLYFGKEVDSNFTTLASVPLGDRRVSYDTRLTMRVRVNNGKARFTIGGLNLLGDMDVEMEPGAVGFYTTGTVNLYMMSIGTTNRWETLERLSVIVDGEESKLGEINRPGIDRDDYGYLILSTFDEYSSREQLPGGGRPEISLDYVFKPIYLDTFTGKKDIKIKLIDAGLWYKMMYLGDAEGMSITYAGDEKSFNRAMNVAVYDYGCKGIGLWVLGQADPRIYETLPDVVPWHD